MMRLIICTLLIFMSAQTIQSQAVFQRSYGGEGSEYGQAVIECSTGGFVLVGSTNSYFDSSTDMYILRVDEVGDYVWGRSIGMPNRIDWARDVKETSEGNILVAGYTNGTNLGDYDASLVKLDADGNMIWSRNYGGEDWDFFENMALSESGEIYIAGQTTLDGELVGWLIKTTESGDILWEKHFPGSGNVKLTGVDICETGHIAFTGFNYNVMLNQRTQISGVVLEDGETDWVAGFQEIGNVSTQNCVCDYNNRILSSSTFHYDSTMTYLFSAISAETGNVEWTEIFGPEVQGKGSGVGYKENGRLLFAISVYDFGYGLLDGFVQIRTSNGVWISVDFSQVFGGTSDDVFNGVIATSDGGYAAVGETNSFGNNYQMYLVKANALNEIDDNNVDFLDLATNTEVNEISWSKPWPNPANELLHLDLLKPSSNAVYHIYDAQGKEWKSGFLKQKNGNATINVANLTMGVYYLHIIHENGVLYTHKFVKSN